MYDKDERRLKEREVLVVEGEIHSINLRITDIRWNLDSNEPSATENDLRRAVDKLQYITRELHRLQLELFDIEGAKR